ncbi:hypothetical protein CK203_077015 [Vitis vinifera]|uniref:Uncharacterized protein n=1 Tax=Vitis vinifera TaxID=29760 RepID=A0A438DIY4_VITVI|nr:hypothetical protein CK203_077015 [Vitis vinifera]
MITTQAAKYTPTAITFRPGLSFKPKHVFFSSKSFNNISLINLYHLCCISNACQDSAQWISDHDPPAHTATDPRKNFPKLGSLFGNHSSELTPVVEEFNRLSVTEISEAFKLYFGQENHPIS